MTSNLYFVLEQSSTTASLGLFAVPNGTAGPTACCKVFRPTAGTMFLDYAPSLAEAWSAVPLVSVHLPFLQLVPFSFNFVFQRSIWAVTAAVVILLLTFLHLVCSPSSANNFFSYVVAAVLQFWNNSVLERVHYKWRDVSMRHTTSLQTLTKPLGFFSLSIVQRKTTGVWVTVLFFVLLCSNRFGLVPLCSLVTGQAGTTLGLSILLLILITRAGIQRLKMRFVKLFLPSGPSWPMAPLFILLESISYSFRLISLGVRLWRNLLSGHMLLHLFLRFSLIPFFCTNRIILAPITRLAAALLITLSGLETMVLVLQSGVFALLASFYLTEVLSKQDNFSTSEPSGQQLSSETFRTEGGKLNSRFQSLSNYS